MFINPEDFGTTIVFALIAFVVICAIYGLIFLKAIREEMTVEISTPAGQIKLTDAVVPNPRFPIVDLTEVEKVEAAQSEDLKDNDLYIQIIISRLRVRSGPGTEFSIVRYLSKGIVVKVTKATEKDKEIWYEIQQPSNLRYPERITTSWFIAGKYDDEWLTQKIEEKEIAVFPDTQPEDKLIKVSLSEQKLEAFEKGRIVFETLVSTGRKEIEKYKTPPGNFRILKKKISVYMQGPLPDDDDYFDLPGIPFDMYFTNEGHAIHGTYWHSDFGNPHSHGCINLPTDKAEWLFWWAEIGTSVVITE